MVGLGKNIVNVFIPSKIGCGMNTKIHIRTNKPRCVIIKKTLTAKTIIGSKIRKTNMLTFRYVLSHESGRAPLLYSV